MVEDEFEYEYMRTLGRLTALITALLVMYVVFKTVVGLDREEFLAIVKDAVRSAVV
jgi:hypothetical protein